MQKFLLVGVLGSSISNVGGLVSHITYILWLLQHPGAVFGVGDDEGRG